MSSGLFKNANGARHSVDCKSLVWILQPYLNMVWNLLVLMTTKESEIPASIQGGAAHLIIISKTITLTFLSYLLIAHGKAGLT